LGFVPCVVAETFCLVSENKTGKTTRSARDLRAGVLATAALNLLSA